MVSFKITVLVVMLIIVFPSEAWRRRRRRRCPVQDCQVSSWSSWSSCSASRCGQQGSQSRSRWRVTSPSCGGAQCPDTYETRNCYGSTPVDCQLSSWSEWSACTTPCGASGTQQSTRHRLETEQCGGTCTSTFRKTRSCPETSCLNGGSSKDGHCLCKEGYYGNCCERGELGIGFNISATLPTGRSHGGNKISCYVCQGYESQCTKITLKMNRTRYLKDCHGVGDRCMKIWEKTSDQSFVKLVCADERLCDDLKKVCKEKKSIIKNSYNCKVSCCHDDGCNSADTSVKFSLRLAILCIAVGVTEALNFT